MAMTKREQAELNDLKRQRDAAVRALNDWRDTQTPQAFSTQEIIGDTQPPRTVTRYFSGSRMECNHAGVWLSVVLYDDHISVSFGDADRSVFSPVTFIPSGSHQFHLKKYPCKEQP